MRTPRLVLGVLAFTLLLMCLLLACGRSDEPTDEPSTERVTAESTDLPDSERATNEPEGRAFPEQTTAARTTEGAEPSPTPRATARPPMVQTSPETDREVLVAFYNATGGRNWTRNNNWLSDAPISEWEGVTTDDNGRAIKLDLRGNQLRGEIPPELVNLANLEWLGLSGNQLSGEMPPELGNLANLTLLSLRDNQLSGEIPPELGNLANLRRLYLDGNQLTGCVPNSLSGRLVHSHLGGLQFCP